MKAKDPLRLFFLLLPLILLLAACESTMVINTTATVSTATTLSSTPAAVNPFAKAVYATPTPLPASVETIVVESEGESWTLPAAVCLRAEGDADVVLVAAQRQVAIVHALVGPMLSGWPTTTYRPRTEEEQAAWKRDLWMAGVAAVTLAGLVGEQAALEQAWVDYEQGFADPGQGWGPPTHISGRVDEWKAGAQLLTEAITAYCSAQ